MGAGAVRSPLCCPELPIVGRLTELPTLKAFETVRSVDGKPARRLTTVNNRALVEAFERAGLEFIPENGGGVGIRFRNRAGGTREEH